MKFLKNLFGRPSAGSGRDPHDDFWYQKVSAPTAAGVAVTPETALKLPVAWNCLNVLSDTIATLPLQVFERLPGGARRMVSTHPIATLLHDDYCLRKQMVWDLATVGNFFAELIMGTRGYADELRWLPPDRVTVQRLADGSIRYKVRGENGQTRVLVEGEVWHIRRPPLLDNGMLGVSPIDTSREAIAAALAVQEYGSRFFQNDCTPPFYIKNPGHFADTESRDNFLRAIKQWWGGKRRHSPGMLERGMELHRVGVNNDEAQFLETRKELAYEIAQIWRMPPHKVGLLDRATNNNIEHQALEFVTDTLLPWLTMIEKAILADLVLRPDRFFAEHNVAGLLRGDLKTRYEAYAQGRNWGWLSVNEIRRLENMNPVPGGDTYLQPLNMVPAGSAGRDADAELVDARGETVSRLFGDTWSRSGAPAPTFENVIQIEDFRNAA